MTRVRVQIVIDHALALGLVVAAAAAILPAFMIGH